VDQCTECGFEYDLARAADAGLGILEGVSRLRALLCQDGADLAGKRSPQVWSPIEYACHVRDVLLV